MEDIVGQVCQILSGTLQPNGDIRHAAEAKIYEVESCFLCFKHSYQM